MRHASATSLAVLAVLAPLGEALAERGVHAGPRSVAAEVELDLEGELRRDLALFRSVADGSPVARRARARRRKEHDQVLDDQRLQRSLAVFRKTQKGSFDLAIGREAQRWGLDPFLFKGLLMNESRLDPSLTGKRLYEKVKGKRRAVGGGARGIAQFTFSGVAAVNEERQRRYFVGERVAAFRQDDVWDPDESIAASAELLASYIERFGRDGGVTAYNTGPYGGRLVASMGFGRAKRSGKLSRVGNTRLQGHRFLLNVLRHANALRRDAGLEALPRPDSRRARKRGLDTPPRTRKRRDQLESS